MSDASIMDYLDEKYREGHHQYWGDPITEDPKLIYQCVRCHGQFYGDSTKGCQFVKCKHKRVTVKFTMKDHQKVCRDCDELLESKRDGTWK